MAHNHSVKHPNKLQSSKKKGNVWIFPNLKTIRTSPQSYLLQRLVDDHFPCLDHGPWPILNVIVPDHFVNLRGLCHSHRVQTNLHRGTFHQIGPTFLGRFHGPNWDEVSLNWGKKWMTENWSEQQTCFEGQKKVGWYPGLMKVKQHNNFQAPLMDANWS